LSHSPRKALGVFYLLKNIDMTYNNSIDKPWKINKESIEKAIEFAKYQNSKEYRNKSSELTWRIMRWELLPKQIELDKKSYEHPFNKFK